MLDLFSGGGGGWCLAALSLGLPSVGIEIDGPACGTRAVVGLPTIRADVSTYPAEVFAGKVEGLCGGPPCQSFSAAGKGKGLADPRGQMVYEPMRYVRTIRPRWVALEQVPEVLGYWRWIARELRTMGYSTWAGILNAADYGVPQIRRRAILLASLDRQSVPPAPTHSKHGAGDLFGGQLAKWVTMAEALGWGGSGLLKNGAKSEDGRGSHDYVRAVDRPAPVVRTSSAGRWRVGTGRHGMRQEVDVDRPAPTVDTLPGRWHLLSPGRSYTAKPRVADPTTEPAPTIALGHNSSSWSSSWCWERPATTVMGDQRVFPPGGHHGAKAGDPKSWSSEAIPVQAWELGVLQGFRADHPWQPPRVSAQIGNAIPPPLALACLRAVTGADRLSFFDRNRNANGVDTAVEKSA